MKSVFIIIVILSLLFLVACGPEQPQDFQDSTVIDSDDSVPASIDSTSKQAISADLIIGDEQITPASISIPNAIQTELTVYNSDNITHNFRVPLYGSEVDLKLEPYEFQTFTLQPSYTGQISIELNSAKVATLVIE